MSIRTLSCSTSILPKEVSSTFFKKSWSIYKKLVDSNGMSHREAYATLRNVLNSHYHHHRNDDDDGDCGMRHNNNNTNRQPLKKKQFNFLDLACGDAYHSSKCLLDTNIYQYTGMDLSETALSYAQQSINRFPSSVRTQLLLGDFCNYEEVINKNKSNDAIAKDDDCSADTTTTVTPSLFDVIWIGLSLHHLQTKEKQSFMKRIYNSLNSDGMLLIYEPICLSSSLSDKSDESSSKNHNIDYYEHFKRISDPFLANDLTIEERNFLYEHVRKHDIPESKQNWLALGRNVGFKKNEILFCDPYKLYCLFSYSK